MIESRNAPWFLRWFDLIAISVGFLTLIVLMLLLAPIFNGNIKTATQYSLIR